MISEEIVKLIEPLSKPLSEIEEMIIREANSSEFSNINKAAQHITLDHGKRLRPILVLASAKAFGSITDEHKILASVIELLHTATLLHDDVLDEAQTRRHRSSVSLKWGNTTSVLLGDYLFARALILLSSLKSPALFALVSEATKDVCEGELLQINHAGDIHFTEIEYFQMIKRKTASLFSASCKGSSIISGVEDCVIEKMARYGDLIGQAFQISDDILDLVGDSTEEGKTLGTDLKKGKMTLPVIHLMKHLNDKDRSLVESMIKDSENELSPVELQAIISKGNGFSETMDVISDLCARALSELRSLPESMDLALFKAIPEYIVGHARSYLSNFSSLLKV